MPTRARRAGEDSRRRCEEMRHGENRAQAAFTGRRRARRHLLRLWLYRRCHCGLQLVASTAENADAFIVGADHGVRPFGIGL